MRFARTTIDTVTKLAQEFGLSPAARGRLQVNEAPVKKETSPWEKFI
jgi:phage terminase small subunit